MQHYLNCIKNRIKKLAETTPAVVFVVLELPNKPVLLLDAVVATEPNKPKQSTLKLLKG